MSDKSSPSTGPTPDDTATFDQFTALWPTPRSSPASIYAEDEKTYAARGKQASMTVAKAVSLPSISSAAGLPASPSATLDEGWEREMTVTSGRRCFGWYGNSGRATSFSRMCLAYLLTRAAYFSPVCRLTWRMQATRCSRQLYFRLWASARRTGETEFSLWPTPQRHDAQGAKTPEQIAAMRQRTKAGVSNLNEQVLARTGLWPTATQRDYKSGTGANPREGHALPLSSSVRGRLNPAWVSLLMGLPADWPIFTNNGNAELRALGNAVVPQVAELLGRMIVEAEG